MTNVGETGNAESGSAAVAGASPVSSAPGRNDAPSPSTEHAQILEERHFLDADGREEIEATDDHGRRWYHLRPEPRGRADLMGFGFTWWALLSSCS